MVDMEKHPSLLTSYPLGGQRCLPVVCLWGIVKVLSLHRMQEGSRRPMCGDRGDITVQTVQTVHK